jgi:hypothetical protein
MMKRIKKTKIYNYLGRIKRHPVEEEEMMRWIMVSSNFALK